MHKTKRILIVDDAGNIRILLNKLLRKWGYETVSAEDGLEAWQILQEGNIDMVISDWMMPNMDGISLCEHIRSAKFPHYTYIILLTSKEDKSDLVIGMQAGADDFVSKPLNKEELKVRIHAGERIIDLQRQLENKNQELSKTYTALSQDLKLVASMQSNLLPSTLTKISEKIDFKWLFQPCKFAGGDIFNIFSLDEEHFAFYSLDVAGHGIPSAMLSFSLHTVITPEYCLYTDNRSPENMIIPPAEVVQKLNEQFQTDNDSTLYFTIVYGVFNTRNNTLKFCHAAHPHPILLSTTGECKFIGEGGFPVGILPQSHYETINMQLSPGDRLILHSDGITECTNKRNEQMGEERLLEFLTNNKTLPLEEVMYELHDYLKSWRGGKYEFNDDISLIALEIH